MNCAFIYMSSAKTLRNILLACIKHLMHPDMIEIYEEFSSHVALIFCLDCYAEMPCFIS